MFILNDEVDILIKMSKDFFFISTTDAELEAGDDLLARSAQVIREAYADTDPDLREVLDDPNAETPIINISVSYDGTWMKRGFTSLYGVGVAIDILTGLVVDYHIMSKYCHACKEAESKNLTVAELGAWKQRHKDSCCVNHTASSKSMETEAAMVLWGRSVEKLKFRYTEMF